MRLSQQVSRAIVAGLLLCLPVAAAGGQPADALTIIVAGMDKQIYVPVILAARLGYFAKAGITVKLVDSRAGAESENELLAGVVQGVVGFYDHTIDLQAKGKQVESIVQLSQAPGEVMVASTGPDGPRTAADLRGHTIGVTGLGSSTDFLSRFICARVGLSRADYTLLPVGAGASFMTAIRTGQIQAGMTTEPTIGRMLEQGEVRVLVDLRTPESTRAFFGSSYPAASLYMQPGWIETHRETAQKLADAFVAALRYIASHDAADIAALVPPAYLAGDPAGYIRALDASKRMFTPDGRMPRDGPETVLKALRQSDSNVRGRAIDLSATYTSEFVDAVRPLAD